MMPSSTGQYAQELSSPSYSEEGEDEAAAPRIAEAPAKRGDLSRMRGGAGSSKMGNVSKIGGGEKQSVFEKHKILFIVLGIILLVIVLVAGIIGALFAMHIIHT